MANRKQLVDRRRGQLLKKGYPSGIVDLAMDWAQNCASGMASYILDEDLGGDNDKSVEQLTVQFLPRYLKDSERWIQAFGHKPKS